MVNKQGKTSTPETIPIGQFLSVKKGLEGKLAKAQERVKALEAEKTVSADQSPDKGWGELPEDARLVLARQLYDRAQGLEKELKTLRGERAETEEAALEEWKDALTKKHGLVPGELDEAKTKDEAELLALRKAEESRSKEKVDIGRAGGAGAPKTSAHDKIVRGLQEKE